MWANSKRTILSVIGMYVNIIQSYSFIDRTISPAHPKGRNGGAGALKKLRSIVSPVLFIRLILSDSSSQHVNFRFAPGGKAAIDDSSVLKYLSIFGIIESHNRFLSQNYILAGRTSSELCEHNAGN